MFFVLIILNGVHGFKVPGNCGVGHFYEPSLMDCLPCPANASLVTSTDGFGCSCSEHSVPSGISKCRPCNITEIVSSDGNSCVSRRCQSSAGRIVCRKCPNDYISVTQNVDGSPMKEVQCVKCARGYKALNNRCVWCEACACKKHEIVVKGNCIPRKYVLDRPKYSENILHPDEVLEFIKLEYLCTNQDYRACRSLASVCVRNHYTYHPAGPCRLWIQSNLTSFKDRDVYSEGALKVQLLVEIQYALKHPSYDTITTSIIVEHQTPDAGVTANLEISGAVLSSIFVVYSLLQCRGATRRGARHFIIVPLFCGFVADALYIATFISSLHAFCSEAGTLSVTLPLSEDEEHLIRSMIYTVLTMKFLNQYESYPSNSQGYKWVMATLVWWISYCCVSLVFILKEKFFTPNTTRLSKLCINLEISLLVFQYEYHAHYVNGRNDDLDIRSMSQTLPHCRLICSPHLRNAFVKLKNSSDYTDGFTNHTLLSQFLGAFFERALDGLSWVASERTVLERLLDIELTEREGGNTSILLYDNNVSIPSLLSTTWMGEEWSLATFDAMVFGCILIASEQRVRIEAELNNTDWRVRPEDVLVEVGAGLGGGPALHSINEVLKLSLAWSGRSNSSSSNVAPQLTLSSFTVGLYKGNRVAVKKIHRKKLDLNKKLLWEIKQARNVSHENTARFIGACVDCPLVFILTEYCPKGSLKDVLANEELQLDWNFRTSLVHDIVQGMCYLHSGLGAHGKLRSSNCLIDGRFVLKISDYGLNTLCTPTDLIKDDAYYYKLLWTAPELVAGSVYPGVVASLKGDVYSFGIILEEIVLRSGPFHHYTATMSNKEIVSRVCGRESPPFRPVVMPGGAGAGPELLELAERCWADSPDDRPSFDTINANYIKGYCDNLMDDLLRRMEQYANNLESLVEEKTEQLSLEKKRSEELLYQVLPRPVAQQLMAGEVVQPESFESVTVYFSDIVGFTELCAASTPMQVVDLLNDLYSTFDRIIGFYDVYKVETIGDAYMVVSGLPERNGDLHAREICLMALAIVQAVRTFVVRHRPPHRLEVRVGVHSGPVCAGVVGVKMPHYCLFGDTVNTASRMESTGQPLRIHLSENTRLLLEQWGTFIVERRGEVELKGRGRMLTHWLLHCSEQEARVVTPDPQPPQYPILFPALPPLMHAPYLVVDPPTLAA
ncbi:unnamed protein product [Danaus chrysippus]|uniref:Guanylate cyclase n=1 Tax=Danaus chrysippus TaxID=151541 RepID=A0A8J2QJ33_9NEOP|nr:unnamed protein product [Danaus chrysippus]